jgi:hypothetical protein
MGGLSIDHDQKIAVSSRSFGRAAADFIGGTAAG